jgi:DNA (cytosine-5)-methyltransferase 3A
MSCGQIALNKVGIKYENYFASEIDKYAIKVTQHNYPNTVQLGSVTELNTENLPNIDLLIGGSPCQSFSFAGKKQGMSTKNKVDILSLEQYLELKDNGFEFDGQSYLFWEYVRILKQVKPKYFLLENVKMVKKWENIITNVLGVKPILINSSLLTAQNRPRLYWTNISNVIQPEDKGLKIKDIIDNNIDLYEYIPNEKTQIRTYKKNYLQYDINGTGHGSQDQRAYYLDNKHGCLDTGASGKAKILEEDGRVRKITRNEGEKLQGVPIDYTNIVSKAQGLKLLGNGWTVDVIAHIFKNIE